MSRWLLVLAAAAALAFVAWRMSRADQAPPGAPAIRPSNHWPQQVTVTHQVHVWHHLVDDRADHPPGNAISPGRVVPGEIVQPGPRELPPGQERLS